MDQSTTAETPHQRAADRRSAGRLDLAEAWRKACAVILEASGVDITAESKKVRDPVSRARRLAEIAAPADMRLSIMLGLGCTPEELERDKSGAKLMLEAATKRLAVVGIRLGESGASSRAEPSERLKEFFERFTASSARAERDARPGGPDAG